MLQRPPLQDPIRKCAVYPTPATRPIPAISRQTAAFRPRPQRLCLHQPFDATQVAAETYRHQHVTPLSTRAAGPFTVQEPLSDLLPDGLVIQASYDVSRPDQLRIEPTARDTARAILLPARLPHNTELHVDSLAK
jgi:hypothetical protein